ncbi:GIY-YIG nuclease family protein [Prolixibacter bellariivorans]|uniref:GIY-YIG nuclease family protein n=1 Tax=Prolixibacter bellariivorans TaxID=314319 RepID=UPI0004723435
MFYLYILHSPSSDIFYVGSTDNVERRLDEHNYLSENSFTSKHRPWHLIVAFEIGHSRTIALKIEKHIKRQKSRKYIEDIIERNSIDRLIARFSSVA